MVLLTIVTNSNPHTLYFDHPIKKPSYIRLLSASLYNSWNNLKEEAVISVADPNRTARANLLPGHYTIGALVNELNRLKKTNPKFSLSAFANTPVSAITILAQNNITFSNSLERFDIRGQPFEKVHYQTPQQHVLRDTSTGDYDVNSLTISVRDEKGNLFDLNGQPLEFELEIN